jgi:nicotinamide phosphoribosyltransferase
LVLTASSSAAEKIFGSTTNGKGFKVLNGVSVIQGDGICYEQIAKILKAVTEACFSAQNVAFGMGASLLQKVNRDTCSFAMKASHVQYNEEHSRSVTELPFHATQCFFF